MEDEKKEVMNLFESHEFKNLVQHMSVMRVSKHAGYSELIRKEGNTILNRNFHNANIHEDIWKQYSCSIAVAESGSEGLALSYGNRSHILIHMGKYEACIKDIDRALNITSNKILSIKLLLRKVKCLHELGLAECKKVYEEAESLWNGIPEASLKKSFKNDMDKVKLLLAKPLKRKSVAKDRQSEMLDELAHQYKVNDFSSVKVHYNNKYGRHLIATKDFQPGDVVFVEKPYVQVSNIPKSHAFCSYCFSTSWANIPCDHCAMSMYCSEECKKEAWNKYHDVECSLYGYAKQDEHDKDKQVAIRMLIMAIKEFGSVEQLKSELMEFDKYTDKKKGFLVDDKIETDGFKAIYTLSRNVSKVDLKKHKEYLKKVLPALARTTSYYGDYFIANDIKSYKRSEISIFLGCLFLRLSKISQINNSQMWNHTYDCQNKLSNIQCWENECCSPGVYIAPVSSLLNHSCNPNVSRCYTKNGTVLVYAVQPIKKASQIFDCYIEPYYIDNLVKRQKILSSKYNFQCDCIACKQQWPDRLNLNLLNVPPVDIELGLQFKNLMIEYATDAKTNYDERTIVRLRNGIEKGLKFSSRPTLVTSNLIDGLQVIFNQIYGINLQVPKECYKI